MHEIKLFAAPLQGYTDEAWRQSHARVYGPCVDTYFSPFVRIEKGEPRRRDLRDVAPVADRSYRLVPQIIFGSEDEFVSLVDALVAQGHRAIDLNLGCPFPLQTRKGRGAAMTERPDILLRIAKAMTAYPQLDFSMKMRLGMERHDAWTDIVDIINSMPLVHITVHPRTGSQAYGGTVDMEQFSLLARALAHPVVYNGDVCTPADIDRLLGGSDKLSGIMAGRGLLARPSLFAEWIEGREWDHDERMDYILRQHDMEMEHAVATYCGDTQILSKLKPFWDYLEAEIGHRTTKAIRKSTTLARYRQSIP